MTQRPTLPPERLAAVTNTLARMLGDDRAAQETTNWQPEDWRAAEWVAYWQNASAWLARQVAGQALPAPPETRVRLASLADDIAERTRRMLASATEFIDALAQQGILAMPLKGALLAPRYYAEAGIRPLGDLDILVHPQDLDAGVATLRRLGYRYYSHSAEDQVYLRGERQSNVWSPDNVQPVELHYHVREEYAGLAYNVAPLLWESAQMGTLWQDHQAPLPTHEALLQHVCAHATSDMLIQRGKLMQLLDIKVVAQRMSDEAWQRFLHDAQANHARFIYPALALAKRYALAPVPPQVLDTLQSPCPAALGAWVERSTMADVSESNPRLRDGIGLELAALLADSPAEKGRMWARSLFPRRRNLTKRYPRLSDSVAWPLCYVILNIDRLYHVIRKATKRS